MSSYFDSPMSIELNQEEWDERLVEYQFRNHHFLAQDKDIIKD